MPDRDSIHKLVDSLPKEALEAAERVLQSSQTWRPEPLRDVATMREDVKQRFAKGPEQAIEHVRELFGKRGIRVPLTSPDPEADTEASGVASEGDTLVTFRICRFRRHQLEIEERFNLSEDKRKLLYSQEIQGPKGKKEVFEIHFDCP